MSSKAFDSLGSVREIRAKLNLLEPDVAESIRDKLEQQAEKAGKKND